MLENDEAGSTELICAIQTLEAEVCAMGSPSGLEACSKALSLVATAGTWRNSQWNESHLKMVNGKLARLDAALWQSAGRASNGRNWLLALGYAAEVSLSTASVLGEQCSRRHAVTLTRIAATIFGDLRPSTMTAAAPLPEPIESWRKMTEPFLVRLPDGSKAPPVERQRSLSEDEAGPLFSLFYEAERLRLYSYFWRRIHNHEESEDESEGLFSRLYDRYVHRNDDTGRAELPWELWLWPSCKNAWVDWLRRRRRENVSLDQMTEPDKEDWDAERSTEAPLEDKSAIGQDLIVSLMDVRRCWKKLSLRQQRCLALQIDSNNYQEIGGLVGLSDMQVKEQLKAARRTLRACCKESNT